MWGIVGIKSKGAAGALGALVGAVLVVTLGAGIAIGGLVTFNDVPEEHPFFDEIEAIAGAGITTGFGDGSYRPGQSVSRGAMAAFMGRGFGRLGFDTGQVASVGAAFTDIAQVDVTAGAVGGTGLVHVTGTADAFTGTGSDCPCRVQLRVFDEGSETASIARVITLPDGEDELGAVGTSMSVQGSFVIPEGTTTYTLQAAVTDSDAAVLVTGELSAVYIPFEGDGTSAGVAAAEPGFDDARG